MFSEVQTTGDEAGYRNALEQAMGTHAFNELALTIDSLFFIAIFFDVALYCVVRGVFSTAKDGRAFLSRAPGLGWRL